MSELSKKFKESIKWDLGRTAYSQVFSFVLSVILARLLTPADFGLVGMAYVVLRIAQVFSDVGFSSSLIQDKDVSHNSYSTVFWINIIAGFFFFALIEIFSPAIAGFYGQDQLTVLMRALGFVFLIDAFCQVQATMLKKKLDFKVINKIVITSNTASGLVAITAALSGLGVWSLIIQALLDSLINLVLYWAYSAWMPSIHFNRGEARRLFKFGAFVFFNQLIYRVSSRADDLIIGKFFSPATLGYYNRAGSILSLVKKYSSSSIIRIVFPYFSLLKDDQAQFVKRYNQIIDLLYFMLFLLTGIFFLGGKEMILIVFGNQWTVAGEYFQIVSLTIFIYPVNAVMSNALLSQGFSKLNFNISLCTALMRIFSMLLVIFTSGDFTMLLYAQVIISILINIIYIYYLATHLKIAMGHQVLQFFKFLSVSAFLILTMLQLKPLIINLPPFLVLFVMVPTYCGFYVLVNLVINKDILMDHVKRIKNIRR